MKDEEEGNCIYEITCLEYMDCERISDIIVLRTESHRERMKRENGKDMLIHHYWNESILKQLQLVSRQIIRLVGNTS